MPTSSIEKPPVEPDSLTPQAQRLFDPDRDVSSGVENGIRGVTEQCREKLTNSFDPEATPVVADWVAFGKQVARERILLGDKFKIEMYKDDLKRGYEQLLKSLLQQKEMGPEGAQEAYVYGRYLNSMMVAGIQINKESASNKGALEIFKDSLFQHEDPDAFLRHAVLLKGQGLLKVDNKDLQNKLDDLLFGKAADSIWQPESKPETLQKKVVRTAWKKYLGLEADYNSLKDGVHKQLDIDRDQGKIESFAKLLVITKRYCGDERELKDEERNSLAERREQYKDNGKWMAHVAAQREQGIEEPERWKNYGNYAKSLMRLDTLAQSAEAPADKSVSQAVKPIPAAAPDTHQEWARTEIEEFEEQLATMSETEARKLALKKVRELINFDYRSDADEEVSVKHSIMQKLLRSSDYLRELVQPDTDEDLDTYNYKDKLPGKIVYHLRTFEQEYERGGSPERLSKRYIKLLLESHLLLKKLFKKPKKSAGRATSS